jgi:uncharacterized protein YjbJ (UPF0337 family)
MNEDTLKGQWTQLKGKAREQWGKLTNDDLDQVEGKAEQLIGRIQERYGVAKDDARRQFDAWLNDEKTPASTSSTRS